MKFETQKERGVVLYLTVVILAIVLAVVLGVGGVLLNQLKLVRDIGASTIAFHAAEAGVERMLRVDACLIVFNEQERIDCLEDVSGVHVGGMNECHGHAAPNDEQECRKSIVQAMQALDEEERTLENGSVYNFAIQDPGDDCEGNDEWGYCGTSTGSFRDAVRRVEVVR